MRWRESLVRRHFIAFYSMAFLVGLALLVHRRIDANWDLLNYHIASAYLFLNGDLADHVIPSGLQTYFPPLVNVPTYLGLTYLGPLGWRLILVAWQSLTWAFLLSACWRVLAAENVGFRIRHPVWTLALLAGLAGASNLCFSVLGASYADLTIAVFIAAGIYRAVRLGFRPSARRGVELGLLLGLAVGLKTTAIVTAAPLAVSIYVCSLIVAARPDRGRLAAEFAVFVAVAAATCAVLLGFWMARVWADTGNPLFPYANGLFHSPLAPRENWSDTTFLPHTAGQWFYRPIGVALGDPNLIGEVALRDIRFAILLYAVGPIGVVLALVQLARRGRAAIEENIGTVCLSMFFVLSLVPWAVLFSIGRYIPVLDILSGFLILRILLAIDPRWGAVSAAILALANVALFRPPNWGGRHDTADGSRRMMVATPAFDRSLVFLAKPPMGWVLPYLGPQSRAVLKLGERPGDTTAVGGPYAGRVEALLARDWPGGIWYLSYPDDVGGRTYFAGYRLALSGRCRAVETWYTRLRACEVVRDARSDRRTD